jgi:hypothetical protein
MDDSFQAPSPVGQVSETTGAKAGQIGPGKSTLTRMIQNGANNQW